MAYDPKELEKLSLEIIENDETVVFVDQIVSKLPCSMATFYNHKLEVLETIKGALTKNKAKIKAELREKWRVGENATTQVALYKLLSTDDERQSLSNHDKVDHNIKGQVVTKIVTEVVDPKQKD